MTKEERAKLIEAIKVWVRGAEEFTLDELCRSLEKRGFVTGERKAKGLSKEFLLSWQAARDTLAREGVGFVLSGKLRGYRRATDRQLLDKQARHGRKAVRQIGRQRAYLDAVNPEGLEEHDRDRLERAKAKAAEVGGIVRAVYARRVVIDPLPAPPVENPRHKQKAA